MELIFYVILSDGEPLAYRGKPIRFATRKAAKHTANARNFRNYTLATSLAKAPAEA
tara:strand:- start:17553 stop:17720 length:168 start_codon:yes stop_codon:yes gene_type:complete